MSLLEIGMRYANDVISGKEVAPPEVITQCAWFLDDLDKQKQDDFAFVLHKKALKKVENLLKIMYFPKGIGVKGKTIYEGLAGFQAFFLVNVFGWRFKDKRYKFRYNDITIFIPRKNAKTFLCAVCIILLMLTEDEYSEFYSICLDRELAAQVKRMIEQIIECSPSFEKYFKIPKSLNAKCVCTINKSFYQPRTAEANRNNSIQPSAFIADEIGAFKDKKNIAAMKSGQLGIRNPLFFKLTTAYAEDKSIMLEELDYLKKIYEGLIVNDRTFALLYYADEKNLWNDTGISMANPLRIEENYQEIRESREKAIDKPSEREEYLTKHMNHFLPSFSGEAFIDIKDLLKCRVKEINWTGKDVYIGLDLALTNDNVSVAMLAEENGNVFAKSWAFIPQDRIEEKTKKERENYRKFIQDKDCFACGGLTVDYLYVEKFIMSLEKVYGVNINKIGYDRYNCESTAQKLENAGYTTVEIKQHSSVLHPATKLLEELILDKRFKYTENNIYEINFQNARCSKDTNLNRYVNKKKSNGKVDMVVSTLDALCLLRIDRFIENEEDDWAIQVI